MLKSIDMVAIYVADWPMTLIWYQEKLGLEAAYVEEDHRFAVLGLPGGGPVLHLVGDIERRGQGQGRKRCVPNVSVDEFDTALEELRGRGVDILAVQEDQEEGYRLASIADPEGNELNIYTFVSTGSSD